MSSKRIFFTQLDISGTIDSFNCNYHWVEWKLYEWIVTFAFVGLIQAENWMKSFYQEELLWRRRKKLISWMDEQRKSKECIRKSDSRFVIPLDEETMLFLVAWFVTPSSCCCSNWSPRLISSKKMKKMKRGNTSIILTSHDQKKQVERNGDTQKFCCL